MPSNPIWQRSHLLAAGILLFLLVPLLYNLGGWGVLETSEARYAEISREMLESGDWLHPRLLGIQHFHKPPVTYMITATGMGIFGAHEFGARFFLQISLLVQALLVYLIGLALYRERGVALTAMLVYLTIPVVLISSRNLTTDSFLTTFELLSIWSWLRYKPARQPGWLYLFYFSLALAFLTKGPVGLIFPVMVVLGYKPVSTAKASLSHHLLALFLFLLLASSWYLYLMLKDKQFVDYFILNHTVDRYANPETFGRSKPWWFYLVLAPALSLPWSAVLLFNFGHLKRLSLPHKRLFVLWLLVPLVFFSLSGSKLILYILPLFAGLALLVASLLHALPEATNRKVFKGSFAYYTFLAFALLVIPFLPVGLVLPWPALMYPVLVIVGLYFVWQVKKESLNQVCATALLFTGLLLPYSTHLLGANAARLKNSTDLAAALRREGLHSRQILVYDRLLPSLAFGLGRNVISVQDQHKSLQRETQFEQTAAWQASLIRLSEPTDSARLSQLLTDESVLVVKTELPAGREWLGSKFKHRKMVGEWVLYY
ncbi:hypothetical protein OB13_17795 [Pontibacter sp. HJ8]